MKKTIVLAAVIITAVWFIACNDDNSTSDDIPVTTIDSSTLGDTFSAASDAVSDATGGLNELDSFGGYPVVLNIQYPEEFSKPLSIKERIYAAFKKINLTPAAWAVFISVPNWLYPPDITRDQDFTGSSVDVYKNFTTTASPNYSQRTLESKYRITGYAFLKWSNLSAGAIADTTQLQQAPHKRYTNTFNNNYITTDGSSTATITCLAPGSPAGSLPVAHSIVWSSPVDSKITINLIRKKYKPDNTALSGHEITTPVPLSMSIDTTSSPKTRTILSGTVLVHHQNADYDADFKFSNVVYNLLTGDPLSGTITISVKKNSVEVGTGTITYSAGTEEYSYVVGGVTHTGTIDL